MSKSCMGCTNLCPPIDFDFENLKNHGLLSKRFSKILDEAIAESCIKYSEDRDYIWRF